MESTAVTRHFSGTYAEARQKFLDAAAHRRATLESFVLPDLRGALGEALAIDVAGLGMADAERLLIVSSGTHGPEGFCGSGCQVAMLFDDDLIGRLARAGVGLLLIHAVNPYGFSYLQRTNQDNVDLNRNHIDFSAALPANDAYPEIDRLVLTETWPPSPDDERALADYIARHGKLAYHGALSGGQYATPDGMFFGGREPTWNNRTMRTILRERAAHANTIAWIDVHTGLGPRGHGEKIYAGRNVAAELARARAWWGADVVAPFDGESESPGVSGPVASIAHDECPHADAALMALEFGTLPFDDVIDRLRASHWLIRHPDAPAELRRDILQRIRDAFYGDDDVWKGAIWGQARAALLQALMGLAAA
ncbi:M14 family metallopeptidase [Burkholderia aenigmatica]|uniref:M14 family metallopeptidase n=1 Tax=Burkholderia aenigmatica TaxID=2015348 RepID=UPI0026508141|nr:M14 family metallopeptidase [Burkholderia aenigmatica]MDN7876173.1 M14 family metallopeptidase [Burkholderia aenigmatica]